MGTTISALHFVGLCTDTRSTVMDMTFHNRALGSVNEAEGRRVVKRPALTTAAGAESALSSKPDTRVGKA